MTGNDPQNQRLAKLISLVGREDHHLLAVRQRFIGDDCILDATRLTELLDDDLGIDRLESFSAKFARMQDTV